MSRDSFYAPEVEIFRAVWSWSKANPDCDIGSILDVVRLSLMSIEELLEVVRPTGLVSPEAILDAIGDQTQAKDSSRRYRGCLCMLKDWPYVKFLSFSILIYGFYFSKVPEENMAHPSRGTQVLQGEMRPALLDGNVDNYDMERGYTRHAINESGDHGILIKLGTQAIINHFKMLLWDRDLRLVNCFVNNSMAC